MSIVTLTESAAAKVKELLARDGHEGYALRLVVAGGGCSGLRYQLKFEEQAGELDHESQQLGVRVLVDPSSAEHLAGTSIDYTDELNRARLPDPKPFRDRDVRVWRELQCLASTRTNGALDR